MRSALGIALLGALLAGCGSDPTRGYVAGGLYPETVQTVAVPIWTRGPEVYRRDLEFRLTEALVKRLELDTPYKVVGRDQADTVLEGSIVAVDQQVLSYNPDTGEPRDLEIRLVVSYRWTDLRTGEVLAERENFRAAGVYYPTEPVGQDAFLGSADAVNLLAQRIVETLEKPW